jgi:hypothetical protein
MKLTPENSDYEDCRPPRKVPGGSMTDEFRRKIADLAAVARAAGSQPASEGSADQRSPSKRRSS